MTGLGQRLRRLDADVVPVVAVRVQELVDAVRGRPADVVARARALAGPLPPGARAGALRRLDDRLARHAPQGLVRVAPGVTGLAVAAVLVAGVGVALAHGSEVAPRPPDVLGPPPGSVPQAYVEQVRARAVEQSRARPGAQHEALVSLTAPVSAAAAAGLVTGLDVQRAYLQAPRTPEAEVLSTDVADLPGDVDRLVAATADRRRAEQRELLRLAADGGPGAAAYRGRAGVADREARGYRPGCACVVALVVRGDAGTLAALPALRGVRAVELAPGGVPLERLTVTPLLPDAAGTSTGGAS